MRWRKATWGQKGWARYLLLDLTYLNRFRHPTISFSPSSVRLNPNDKLDICLKWLWIMDCIFNISLTWLQDLNEEFMLLYIFSGKVIFLTTLCSICIWNCDSRAKYREIQNVDITCRPLIILLYFFLVGVRRVDNWSWFKILMRLIHTWICQRRQAILMSCQLLPGKTLFSDSSNFRWLEVSYSQ